ncbi:hypothetical protein SPOG_03361 [Schizosaccharomyces cryophilus OY26]|uniref:Uncharacterized protein n=1 Tax=Schizosaccharomyces cryophilus (strain OY26 / ATCC MYA-4695 / CBS 11777 / NBRC 106824 / NRRL Y48691) TaxID=653667 RepID=S9VV11_SCHCR|nr:uncharacterized protein SPOG_03361 [Schizosaccharomyces cryophilus OY26]EPY49890.1 hypothetical protein SPOG_03361 [Schizosaccharomyces cryophilus OY26]
MTVVEEYSEIKQLRKPPKAYTGLQKLNYLPVPKPKTFQIYNTLLNSIRCPCGVSTIQVCVYYRLHGKLVPAFTIEIDPSFQTRQIGALVNNTIQDYSNNLLPKELKEKQIVVSPFYRESFELRPKEQRVIENLDGPNYILVEVSKANGD